MFKYEIIADDIERKIIDLTFKQKDKLPSLIELSKQYQCSKATAIKAYELLEEKHLIYAKHQSGYYVADNEMKPTIINDDYPLNTGNPFVNATSLVDAKHCLSIAIEQYSNSSLNISLHGVDSLRDILPEFLAQLGVYTKVNNIFLTQGVTQMLSFLSMSPFFKDKQYVLIEEPTYSYYVDFLKSMNIPVITIKRDENDIDLQYLESLFKQKNIKFFYTIPRNHNPLGTTLHTKVRKKIAELALKYNTYIIEDDYFGHCSSNPKYLPIHYYTYGKNCIYLTSFTKTMPYIRIGICVIPENFNNAFYQLMHQSYYFSYQLPSLISQATFESYLRSGLYKKQTQRLQNQLKKHYHIIKNISKQWNHDIAYIVGGTSGYYFSIVIQSKEHFNKILNTLKNNKILVVNNQRCFYHSSSFNQSIRLSIARIEADKLEEALNMIYHIIYEESNYKRE